jgi:hypothetical protein
MPVADVVNQGTMAGCAITNIRVAYWGIIPLCHGSQVMDRSLTRNLNMALQTIPLHQEGDDTTAYILLMAVQASINNIIETVLICINYRSNCFTNTDFPASFT